MSDKIEAQGKTVQEAVNEALLRMGARQDEVKVTVVDEPKSGFLGLGGRQAKVLVEKKGGRHGRSGRRDFREKDDNYKPHALNEGSGSRSSRGSRGRGRGRRSEKPEGQKTDNRRNEGQKNEGQRTEAAQSGQGRSRRTSRSRRSSGEDRPAQDRQGQDRQGQDRQGQDRQGQDRQGRDRQGRDRPGRDRQEARNDNRRQEPRADSNGEQARSGGRGVSRSRRSRSNRANQDGGRNPRQDTRPAAAPEVNGNRHDNGPEQQQQNVSRENSRADGRHRGRRPARPAPSRPAAEVVQRPQQREVEPAPVAAPRIPDVPDVAIVSGIKAVAYAQPIRDIGPEEVGNLLDELTNGVLARGGFPVRATVTPDEYFQVKVTTDDSSAGMLIGRHGATIDALEHLIDRMAGMGAGDRVRMNLDINNYRRRRSEVLDQRVIEAVEKVNEGGRPYHMEPMCARERRIVHLSAESEPSVKTFTMSSSGGKHVVIAPVDNPRVEENSAVPVVDADLPAEAETASVTLDEKLPELEGYTEVVEAEDVPGEPDDFGEDEFKNPPPPAD